MAGVSPQRDWVDGFLFLGNQLALDFLNTKPILDGEPRELLSSTADLERWLTASGVAASKKSRAQVRAWRDSIPAKALLEDLLAFRERLRAAVRRLEAGQAPRQDFLQELNILLRKHPLPLSLGKQGSKVVLAPLFEPREPEDVWTPIVAAAAELLSGLQSPRIRKCESESCVIHFYDTSKKGSRRWCSMNICGNRLKVAAYQKRRRLA